MQVPNIFFNNGHGWQSFTDHNNNVAALEDFTIRWGTDSVPEQPEPGVMTFTLLDRTGDMAGAALDLSGARVIVQLSPQPTWGALTPAMGTWGEQNVTLEKLHQSFTPDPASNVSAGAITLFDGIISNGGSVIPTESGWLLELSATSRMLLWKRLKNEGPTSTAPKYEGLHWVGTGSERIKELRTRAAAVKAPGLSTGDLSIPEPLAPYSDTDFPDQLTLLQTTFGHSPRLPLWFEYPDRDHSEIRPYCVADPVTVGLSTTGTTYVTNGTETRPAFDGSTIAGDLQLEIPEPTTQITVTAKKVTTSDNKLEFAETDLTYSDLGQLPANLKATQSSTTLTADIITTNEAAGLWTDGVPWSPTTTDKTTAADWLRTINMRLKPGEVTFTSTSLDPASYPWLFWTAPSGPLLFIHTVMSNLTGSDDRPAFSGAYTTTGGTLSFRWREETPVLTHEATLTPLPAANTTALKWSDFEGNPATWADMTMTLAEMSIISTVDTE